MLVQGAQAGPWLQQATSLGVCRGAPFPSAVDGACRLVLAQSPILHWDTRSLRTQCCQSKQEWDMARSCHGALLPCMEDPDLPRPKEEV